MYISDMAVYETCQSFILVIPSQKRWRAAACGKTWACLPYIFTLLCLMPWQISGANGRGPKLLFSEQWIIMKGWQKRKMETRDIEFEGLIVRAPKDIDGFLTYYFGPDYMTPPPKDQRLPRHTVNYIEFGEWCRLVENIIESLKGKKSLYTGPAMWRINSIKH